MIQFTANEDWKELNNKVEEHCKSKKAKLLGRGCGFGTRNLEYELEEKSETELEIIRKEIEGLLPSGDDQNMAFVICAGCCNEPEFCECKELGYK